MPPKILFDRLRTVVRGRWRGRLTSALRLKFVRYFNSVAALVNNATTLDLPMRLNAISADRLSLIFAVNVLGPMVCARGASKGALEAFT